MNTTILSPSSANKEVISWKQRLGMSLVCTCLFLFVYALTAGPMVKLITIADVGEFKTTAKYLYAPIVFLVEQDIEPFATVLKWYISLFQ